MRLWRFGGSGRETDYVHVDGHGVSGHLVRIGLFFSIGTLDL